MRFSVIVPIFNVEDYLEKCVNSIINQSYQDYELILVNDGSTDRSGSICDSYASQFKRVKVIHQQNAGVSDARNSGLKLAVGEYVIFIDSDDYIEPDSFDKFHTSLDKSGNPDVMIARAKKIYADRVFLTDQDLPFAKIVNGNKADVIKWMFVFSDNLWPSTSYVVRKSFIDDNNIEYLSGYLHEDIEWTFKIFLFAKTFTANEYYWYNRRMERPGSITNTKLSKRTLDVINLVSKNIGYDNMMVDQKLITVMYQRMLSSLFSSLSDYRFYDKKGKNLIAQALKENKDVFRYSTEFRHKCFVIFSRVFGFKMSLFFMTLVHRV